MLKTEINNKEHFTFRILLKKEDLQLILPILFCYYTALKKEKPSEEKTEKMKNVKQLLKEYTKPKNKEKNFYIHTLDSLFELIWILEEIIDSHPFCKEKLILLNDRLKNSFQRQYKKYYRFTH